MKVQTRAIIKTPQGEIPVGKIINIPAHLAERLKGKVRPITDTEPFKGAFRIRTPEGESIWIATEPEDVKLIPEGALYFLGDEIEQLHKVGKESARAVLMVKQVFGNGSKVIESHITTKEECKKRIIEGCGNLQGVE